MCKKAENYFQIYVQDIRWGGQRFIFTSYTCPFTLTQCKESKNIAKSTRWTRKTKFWFVKLPKKQCSRWDGQRFIFTSCTLHLSASHTHYKTLKKPGKYCQKRCVRFVFTFYICPPYILTARRQKKAEKYCKTRCVIYHFHFLHLPPLHTPC